MIEGKIVGESILLEDSDSARDLYAKSQYGTILKGGIVKLGFFEGTYLSEKGIIEVKNSRNKILDWTSLVQRGRKLEKTFPVKYSAYRDLRKRGYIVKTALKFGADFRVYEKGIKPGEDHAKWVVYAVHESQGLTWHEFSAKNRVAHGTRKKLLIAVVDDEDDVTYWEVEWTRP